MELIPFMCFGTMAFVLILAVVDTLVSMRNDD